MCVKIDANIGFTAFKGNSYTFLCKKCIVDCCLATVNNYSEQSKNIKW